MRQGEIVKIESERGALGEGERKGRERRRKRRRKNNNLIENDK
jgi:hypothetical protein